MDAGYIGAQPQADLRGAMNALRCMLRSDCEWRMLPMHFPAVANGPLVVPAFRTIHDLALMIDREPLDKALFLDFAVKVVRRISHT